MTPRQRPPNPWEVHFIEDIDVNYGDGQQEEPRPGHELGVPVLILHVDVDVAQVVVITTFGEEGLYRYKLPPDIHPATFPRGCFVNLILLQPIETKHFSDKTYRFTIDRTSHMKVMQELRHALADAYDWMHNI